MTVTYLEKGIDSTKEWLREAGWVGGLVEFLVAAILAFLVVLIILKAAGHGEQDPVPIL